MLSNILLPSAKQLIKFIFSITTTMKKIIVATLFCISALAQPLFAQDKCLSEIIFQENAAKNPQILRNREDLEKWTEKFVEEFYKQDPSARMSMVPKIIPVVVHVIHYGGPENISYAQIVDQIDSLNKDYRRMNADTVNTPAVFKPLGADVNAEFRLAQLDPNGNCTDGVTRTYSPLTYSARDNVKALADWPCNKYLNLWVVNSIDPQTVTTGMVVGYAQFPGGANGTDGVVVKYDFFGSIGAAANSGGNGRTATHEIGHWMNLRHVWGDAQCGNDFVNDTPTQFAANLSTCPTWPHITACTGNSPTGDMFSDYMDYTNGNCQNMFSVGQVARMTAALTSATSGRNNLWTSANLIATGTDGTAPVICGPTPDFIPHPLFVCPGGSLSFNDMSWNGVVASRVWTFPGGTPSTDTSATPVIMYNTPGTYDVTLTVTNAGGTNSKTVTGMVTVSNATATGVVPFSEGFESGNFPFNDWYIINDNGGNTWEVTGSAASVGNNSLYIDNSGNDKGPDEFITPAFNLTNVTGTQMKFDLAYAISSSTGSNTDKLKVLYSTNCGQTWTSSYVRSGTALATTTTAVALPTTFVPAAADWRTETVNLSSPNISTQPNVRFRFEFTHDKGNNIYVDNINIIGNILGVDQLNAENATVDVYPNPSSSKTYVKFTTFASDKVKIDVMDISGRIVSSFSDEMPAGDHEYQMENNLEKGTYMVRLTFGSAQVTKKVVIN